MKNKIMRKIPDEEKYFLKLFFILISITTVLIISVIIFRILNKNEESTSQSVVDNVKITSSNSTELKFSDVVNKYPNLKYLIDTSKFSEKFDTSTRNFTFIVPENLSFNNLNEEEALAELSKVTLEGNIFLEDFIKASDLDNLLSIKNLAGKEVKIELVSGKIFVNDLLISSSENFYNRGIIYTVN